VATPEVRSFSCLRGKVGMGVLPQATLPVWREPPPVSHLSMRYDLPRKRERLQQVARSPRHHALNVPPVFFVTSATIFAATASISWSVSVFSRGWIVTAMAIDFLSGSMPLPS
jgi:hypothetical protein